MTRFVVNRETRHLTGWHRWHFWSNWKKQTSEKLKFKPITTAKPDKAICFAHWWNRYGNGSLTNRNFKFTFYSAIAKEGGRKWTVFGLSEPVNFETDRQMICESFELKKTKNFWCTIHFQDRPLWRAIEKLVFVHNKFIVPFKNLFIQILKRIAKHKLIAKEWSTTARKCIQSNNWPLATKGNNLLLISHEW